MLWPLPMHDDSARILLAAEGYIDLGMLDQAAMELEKIPPEGRMREEVLTSRCRIFMEAKRWKAMRDVAKHLVSMNPKNLQHWIWAAYATRRAESLEAAREVLKSAWAFHPEHPLIFYNLACYACQMGKLEEARSLLHRAIEGDQAFKAMALGDPDLEPLW